MTNSNIVLIPLDQIHPNPNQPRRHFADIEELAGSLKKEGQLSTVVVRPVESGYEIVYGERRWRAAQLAGLPTLKAEVWEMSREEAYRLALVENIQRKDLNPVEEARGFETLAAQGMSQKEIGALVGKSQSYIAHKLRLVRAPRVITELVAYSAISENHARQLLRFEGLIPEGRGVATDKLSWLTTAQSLSPDQDGVDALTSAFNILRPEELPPLPLYVFPNERVANSPHLAAFLASYDGLVEYVSKHTFLPQWIINAWWWGAGAALYDLPVGLLTKVIDAWYERYQAAHMFLMCYPELPEDTGEELNLLAKYWWGYWADLKHAHALPASPDDVSMQYVERVLDGASEPLPTQFQGWVPAGR